MKPMNHKLSTQFNAIMREVKLQTSNLTDDERVLVLKHLRDEFAVMIQAIGTGRGDS